MNEIAYLIAETTNHVVEAAPVIAAEAGAHAAEVAEAESQTGLLGTFGISWKLFLAQLLNFGIIVFVLTKFVFKPLLKTMDERKSVIVKGLNDAKLAEDALEKAKQAETEIVVGARRQAKELIDEAKNQGETEKQRRIEKSSEIINQRLAESKIAAQKEAEESKKSAEKEIGTLVISATQKVTNGLLDEKKHRKLIDDAIKELESYG